MYDYPDLTADILELFVEVGAQEATMRIDRHAKFLADRFEANKEKHRDYMRAWQRKRRSALTPEENEQHNARRRQLARARKTAST